jgi:hypothetical protein
MNKFGQVNNPVDQSCASEAWCVVEAPRFVDIGGCLVEKDSHKLANYDQL